jgi:hypothetical protein
MSYLSVPSQLSSAPAPAPFSRQDPANVKRNRTSAGKFTPPTKPRLLAAMMVLNVP